MKVKCILKEGVTGIGFENFKFNEVRNLKKDIAELLISFGYAEDINKNYNDQENNNDDNEDNNENNNQEGGEEKLLI